MSQESEIEAVIAAAVASGESHFSLRGRNLTSLPPSVGELTAVTQLSLADNALTTLPPAIGQLTQLTHLNLKNNRLQSLPREITQLVNLEMLQLQGNPLPIPPAVLAKWDRPAEILTYYREHLLVEPAANSSGAAVNVTSLHWIISEQFDEAALRELCDEIAVDYEGLGGKDKEERIRSLIAFHEYHGLGDEFIRLIKSWRPDVFPQ